jgi:hypothetical protein
MLENWYANPSPFEHEHRSNEHEEEEISPPANKVNFRYGAAQSIPDHF